MLNNNTSNEELAYALITPYSLHKSRTGGIIARLLWADVHLSAVRMYAPEPGGDFLEKYCDAIYDPEESEVPLKFQRLVIEYVMENLARPNVKGISNRMMVLVFQGPNAQRDIKNAVGHIGRDVRGDDVRGTFGDFIIETGESGDVNKVKDRTQRVLERYPLLKDVDMTSEKNSFFEPAVLTATSKAMNEAHLKLFNQYAYSDGGFVLNALGDVDPEFETSMVILKPESFRRRNPLPGNLVDFFSRLGLFITGAKMISLSFEQAREFYGDKLEQFRSQLKGMIAEKTNEIIQKASVLRENISETCGMETDKIPPGKALKMAQDAEYLFSPPKESGPGEVKKSVVDAIYAYLFDNLQNFSPDEKFFENITEELKGVNAKAEFDELIRYMSGADPETGRPLDEEGDTHCMALLYSGRNSFKSIRRRLKELRDVYGQNILYNRAHASDPDEDPVKERRILGMPNSPQGEAKPCDLEELVNQFYGDK